MKTDLFRSDRAYYGPPAHPVEIVLPPARRGPPPRCRATSGTGPCSSASRVRRHGPYSAEPETVARIREYLVEHSLEISATHHEIYVSDARRLPEEKWTTVLRFPVRPLSVGADGGPAID